MSRQSGYSVAAKVSTTDRIRLATTSNTHPSQLADELDVCDPITGVAVPVNNDITAITDFVNEACDQVSIRGSAASRLPELYHDTSEVDNVKDYFIRPKLLNTITYNSTVRGSLATYDCGSTQSITSLYNFGRIKGAFGWRATFCFRLQAVATPFQAGILRMAFSPFEGRGTVPLNNAITPISQLPGVDLDIAQTTSVILKVPFIHSLNYFIYNGAIDYNQSLGTLSVFAMTPYTAAAGVVAPRLALWHWLEDFELIGAAPYDLIGAYPGPIIPPPATSFTDLTPAYEAQMGKLSPAAQEAAAIPGNISNVLAAGANLTRWVAGRVPSLSAIAGPASWLLRETSKVAASYGWSRPISVQPHNKVLNTVNAYQNNSDGPDPSYNLGLFTDNAVNPVAGFAGSDVDEMAIHSIISIPAVITEDTLSTADVVGGILCAIGLSPYSMWFQDRKVLATPTGYPTDIKGMSFWPSPLMSVANCFKKWRGSFKFRVRIAKTKFHTGRLILGFTPAHQDLTGLVAYPSDATLMQYKSVVWDLREANEIEFECPFIQPSSYLDNGSYSGTFFIAVLEPLAGPSTVSQTLPVLIDVCGGSDFEFAIPICPFYPLSPVQTTFESQSGIESVLNTPGGMPSAMCIGEKINSIKQLIMRAGPVLHMAANSTWTIENIIQLPAWQPSFADGVTLADYRPTLLNYFMASFGLYRGGFVIDTVPFGDSIATANLDPFTNNAAVTNFGSVVTESKTGLHVKVPYYGTRSRTIVQNSLATRDVYRNAVKMSMSKPDTNASSLVYMRAADDFQFGYYRAAAPLCHPKAGEVLYSSLLIDFTNTIHTAH